MLERMWKKILRRRRLSLWGIPAFFLWLASLVYRLGYRFHRQGAADAVKVGVPVISVGNITVGGSGKTPLVGFIAHDLLNEGIRVGVVSSAYGRQGVTEFVEPGYKVQQMAVTETGDEVKLLAMSLPEAVFSIHPTKLVAAQRLAESSLVDVMIVDDGFQHVKLARDLDIVAYDAGVKKRYLKMFPYGILREPKHALKRADIVIVTRAEFARDLRGLKRQISKLAPKAEMYHAGFGTVNIIGREQTLSSKYLEDKSVFLFAGVGNFRSLRRQVSALSSDLDHALELSDHQEYDSELLAEIKRQADKHDSDLILTTLKDWVKLGDFDFGREIYYLDLNVDLDPGEEKLLAYICDKLKLPRRER